MRSSRVLPGVLPLFVGGRFLLGEFDATARVPLWPVVLILIGAGLSFESRQQRRA